MDELERVAKRPPEGKGRATGPPGRLRRVDQNSRRPGHALQQCERQLLVVGVVPIRGEKWPPDRASLPALAAECLDGITRTADTVIDGQAVTIFTEPELQEFQTHLTQYYQDVSGLAEANGLDNIAVVGGSSAEMVYYLMTDTSLVSRYVFYDVHDYYDYSLIAGYDGLIISEWDYSINSEEAIVV